MTSQKIKFLSKKPVAVETVEFDFAKPQSFAYIAGQYLIWRFPDLSPVDAKGNQRDFTMSSSPFEDRLAFTTRIRDTAFKKWAQKLQPGEEIEIDGPHGDMVLPQDVSRPVVFIAGGIGITPFRSMAVQAAHENSAHKIVLFHFDKSTKDMPYFQEMTDMPKRNPNFKFIPVLTKSDPSWTGETGYLSVDLLKKYLDLHVNLYMAAGPPKMVDAIRETLSKVGITEENVLGQNFGGY